MKLRRECRAFYDIYFVDPTENRKAEAGTLWVAEPGEEPLSIFGAL